MSNYIVKTSSLSRYLAEINRFPLLSREQEYSLAMRYREKDDLEAAHTLVTSNLRFVVKIAMQYKNYGVKLKDLIQEGNIGLMTAVKKFDPAKGFRLISYAVWWIRAFIQKFILETLSLIKVGSTRASRKLFSSMAKIKAKLTQMGGAEPSDEQIADALDIPREEVTGLKQIMASRDNSLDAPLNNEAESTRIDMLESSAPNQEEIIGQRQERLSLRNTVVPFIEKMKDKERFIVEKRLLADEPATLQEIGDKFNISRERARQIENSAINKIRGYLTEKGYSPSAS